MIHKDLKHINKFYQYLVDEFIIKLNELVFLNLEPAVINILGLCFLMLSFQSYSFLYGIIMVLHLISSFSITRSLLVAFAYVSIKSIDCIILSSFELEAILLISSVRSLCLLLLNLRCVLNINLLFLMNSLQSFLRLSMLISSFSK